MASISSSTDAKGKGKAFENILTQPLLPFASFSSSMVCEVFLFTVGVMSKCDSPKISIMHSNARDQVFPHQEVFEYGASIPVEIENAMRTDSLCIAIFSSKYAESSWCLDKSSVRLKNGAKIIPIFYNVEPSDLRWVALRKEFMPGLFPSTSVDARKEWKTALYNVSYSFLYGHRLKNMQIVPLEVARYPVGLDEIVRTFKECI